MFVIESGDTRSKVGSYIRLFDFDRPKLQQPKALEAIRNPDCGWFYRRDAETFKQIPGTPIAYWVGGEAIRNWDKGVLLSTFGRFLNGMSTGKNEAVLREWYEVGIQKIMFNSTSELEFASSGKRYAPYNKGGDFRKWYGNQCSVIAYDKSGNELMDSFIGHRHNNPDTYFLPSLSWSKVSSGHLAMRHFPCGFVYDVAGCSLFLTDDNADSDAVLAFYNSSSAALYLQFLCPSLNFEAGQIKKTPWIPCGSIELNSIRGLSDESVDLSKADWDSFETSWDFKRHPLV